MLVRTRNFIDCKCALSLVLLPACVFGLAFSSAIPTCAIDIPTSSDTHASPLGSGSSRAAFDVSTKNLLTVAAKSIPAVSVTTVTTAPAKTTAAKASELSGLDTASDRRIPILLPLHPVLDSTHFSPVAALPGSKTSLQSLNNTQSQPVSNSKNQLTPAAPSMGVPTTAAPPLSAPSPSVVPNASTTVGTSSSSSSSSPSLGASGPSLQETQLPTTGDRSAVPQLRGPAGLPAVTIPKTPMRKLHVDMGDTVPDTTWQAGGSRTPGEQAINDVAGGLTPLRVRQVMNEALINSPKVAAIRLNLGITKALYAGATQLPNPVFFRDEAPQSEGVRRVGPNVTYELPWKLAFRLLTAKRAVQEQKLELLQQLWQFRNDVRRAFTEVVVAQETYETFHDLSELALKLQEVSSKRFQAGDVPELDVLKSRLAYSQASVDTAQGNMRVNRSRQQLNVIMGRQFGSPISAPRLPTFNLSAEKSELLPDFSVPIPPVTDFISEAMDNRLEIKINDAQIRLTKAQLLTTSGNIIPNPMVAYGSSTETNLPSGPKLNGLYTTINAEFPLYNFQQGDLTRLRATLKQFKAQGAAIRNQIIADVTNAYNNLITARNRIRTYQDHVLADSAEVARLARRSYEVGQSDITATLAAQQANVQVRQAYLDAVSSYQQSFTDLEQSVGEPID